MAEAPDAPQRIGGFFVALPDGSSLWALALLLSGALAVPSAIVAQSSAERQSLVSSAASLPRKPSPDGAAVYLISPRAGEVVGQTFTAVFGLRGMGVAPAGSQRLGTGHHHLLLNYPGTPLLTQPLPSGKTLRHFGGGQTEVVLNLPPGRHQLRLLFADGIHLPHDPPLLSAPVHITVR